MAYTPATVAGDILTLLGGTLNYYKLWQAYTQTLTLLDYVFGRDSGQYQGFQAAVEGIYSKNAQAILFVDDESGLSTKITTMLALCDDSTNAPTIDIQQRLQTQVLTTLETLYGPGCPQISGMMNELGIIKKQVPNLGMQQIRSIDAIHGVILGLQSDLTARKQRVAEIIKGVVTGLNADLTEGF